MEASTQTMPEDTAAPKLKDQAATAALYVTKEKRSKGATPLDKDGKLSSAGAAASLKHAGPRDLPAFPIVGISNPESSAGAAASLAAANHKDFEHWKPSASAPAGKAAMLAKDYQAPQPWKPEPSGPANTAAMLAKDYKAPPAWKPSMSSAGSKAAVLAARGHTTTPRERNPQATATGNSAASQAMHKKLSASNFDYDLTRNSSARALTAATGAMANRNRAGSSPNPSPSYSYPDAANSASNALNAATLAHRPSQKKPPLHNDLPGLSPEAATKIHNAAVTNMSRDMYTSNPPVAPEVEERNRQAGLRAAAMSMAKSMYDSQQKALESRDASSDSRSAATHMHNRRSVVEDRENGYNAPAQYMHLQEAAQKLAAERLAKLHDKDAEYRDYYGASMPQRSRLSLRGNRRRSSSASQVQESDQERSRRIRHEMSGLNNKLEEVDSQKRQKDRASLLAAARRNVTKSMHGMDEKVFAETGKASPAMHADWEAKARARAEAKSSARMVNHGKVAIGGGKYLDQSEVDAIAAAKVKPTLDEISKEADDHRARDEARRKKIEEEKHAAELKKLDDKEREARTDEEWRRFKEEEKLEKKMKKEQEKIQKADEKRMREEQLKMAQEKQSQKVPEAVSKKKVTSDAPYFSGSMTETVISGGRTKDEPSQETSKKSSWFRRFSRHSGKPTRSEEVPTQPNDASRASGPSTTNDPPLIKESVPPETITAESKKTSHEASTAIEPTTGLPLDTSKGNPDFGKDETPRLEPPEPEWVQSDVEITYPAEVPEAAYAKEDTTDPTAVPPVPFLDITRTSTGGLNSSERDVAMAGKITPPAAPRSRSTSISSVSSDEPATVLGSTDSRGRTLGLGKTVSEEAASGRKFNAGNGGAAEAEGDDNGDDEFQEARDGFNAEDLPRPQAAFTKEEGRKASPARETRFKEEL